MSYSAKTLAFVAQDWGNQQVPPTLRGRRDGSCFPVEISLSPVKSAGGLGVTAIIRDISELLARNEEIEPG